MKLVVEGLGTRVEVWEAMAQFDRPLDKTSLAFLREEGFDDAAARAVGCMGWIWCQWLMAGPEAELRRRITAFVDRGIEIQGKSSLFQSRPTHDLYLLHCAIFGATDSQITKVAKRAVDSSGQQGNAPRDDGQLYASAWSGMLKYWILGDGEKAARESLVIWRACRNPAVRAASKPVVTPWLKEDWKAFVKAQAKDFQELWSRARKNGTVRSKTKHQITVSLDRYQIEQYWCWAHCGMALLAYRRGIQVATDPFWFPPHALKCVDRHG